MIDYQRMFARDDGERTAYPITFGDRRPDVEYVVSEDIELAVNVALATGRPLLVLGAPGSGKTSLGFAVARRLAWDEYGFVVTSRTRAQDLLWTFDNVRRLSHALGPDAEDAGTKSDERYLRPGVLWWALAPERAAAIVAAQGRPVPSSFTDGAVVVIDEIDKADPGVPNDLLRPLGDLTFEAIDVFHEQVTRKRARPPLVVITSNGERTLAPAFVRRCVVIELAGYDRDRLLAIAAAHFPGLTAALIASTLDHLIALSPKDAQGRPDIGTAEFLDLLRAAAELDIGPASPRWQTLAAAAVLKRPARTE